MKVNDEDKVMSDYADKFCWMFNIMEELAQFARLAEHGESEREHTRAFQTLEAKLDRAVNGSSTNV